MNPLRIEDGCLIVPADGVLHVFNRRGTFDLRGKHIDRLHAKLLPHLRGTLAEAELLAAVPAPMAAGVRGYLERLRAVGALHVRPAPDAEEPLAALGAACAVAADGAGTLHVSLDGLHPDPALDPGCAALCFATEAEAGELLAALVGPERPVGRLTCVVAEPVPGGAAREAELERRAGYARWLARNDALTTGGGGRFRLFRLGADGTLKRLADVREGAAQGLRTLPDQLRLVGWADADQVPLVVATASHPLAPATAAAYGVAYDEVQRFLTHAHAARSSDGAFFEGDLGAPLHRFRPSRAPARDPRALAVAPSLLHLRLALLERAAEAAEWEEVDLLATPPAHPVAAYLRDVLLLRRGSLPARRSRGAGGMAHFRTDASGASSLWEEKARAEVLLAEVWREFYPDFGAGALPALGPRAFATDAEIRGRVRSALAAAPRVPVRVRRVRRWGITTWTGELAAPSSTPPTS